MFPPLQSLQQHQKHSLTSVLPVTVLQNYPKSYSVIPTNVRSVLKNTSLKQPRSESVPFAAKWSDFMQQYASTASVI
jgi:hypothetical protein